MTQNDTEENKLGMIPDIRKILDLPDGELFVAMTVFSGTLVIATNKNVYSLLGGYQYE